MATEIQSEQGVLEQARQKIERMASRSGLLGREKQLMAEIGALQKRSKKFSVEAAAIVAQMELSCPRYSNPDRLLRDKAQPIVSLPGYPDKLSPAHREQALTALLEATFNPVRRETLNSQCKQKYDERDAAETEIKEKQAQLNATRSELTH